MSDTATIVRVDDILPRVGQALADARREPWLRAILKVEISFDGQARDYKFVTAFSVRYETPDGRTEYLDLFESEELGTNIKKWFREIWNRYAKSPNGSWTRATFTLQRSGKAALHFDYGPPSWAEPPSGGTER